MEDSWFSKHMVEWDNLVLTTYECRKCGTWDNNSWPQILHTLSGFVSVKDIYEDLAENLKPSHRVSICKKSQIKTKHVHGNPMSVIDACFSAIHANNLQQWFIVCRIRRFSVFFCISFYTGNTLLHLYHTFIL